MCICRQGLAAVLVCSLAMGADAARASAAQFQTGGDASLGYDDNIGNAGSSSEEEAAGFASATLNADFLTGLSNKASLLLRGSFSGEGYSRFSRLSNGKAGAMLRLSWRPDGGFYVPTVGFSTSAAYRKFGSRLRDSGEYRASLFLDEQITTSISTRLTAQASRRVAAGKVFDLSGSSLALDLDCALGPAFAVYGGYQFHYGDQVSTGSPTPARLAAAEAMAPDDAFGGSAANRFAYRMPAHTQIATLGFNYALSHRYALDAQFQAVQSKAGFGNRYGHAITVVSLLARF